MQGVPLFLVDNGAAALLAIRRAKQLRKKLRRPLFVGRCGGARAFALYHSGQVLGGGTASSGTWMVARHFRFAPVARPPQLPAIEEAEGDHGLHGGVHGGVTGPSTTTESGSSMGSFCTITCSTATTVNSVVQLEWCTLPVCPR